MIQLTKTPFFWFQKEVTVSHNKSDKMLFVLILSYSVSLLTFVNGDTTNSYLQHLRDVSTSRGISVQMTNTILQIDIKGYYQNDYNKYNSYLMLPDEKCSITVKCKEFMPNLLKNTWQCQ